MQMNNAYRLAVISDVHIGDPRCTLFSIMDEDEKVTPHAPYKKGEIYFNSETQNFYKYPQDRLIIERHSKDPYYRVKLDMSKDSQYTRLVEIAKEVDNLIILGDLFDIAMQRNDIAYELVKVFLDQLRSDAGTKEFIYIPGNHDYSLWRHLQWESDVTQQVNELNPAKMARHVVPGILSFKDNKKHLQLFEYVNTEITKDYPEDNSEYLLIEKKDYEHTHMDKIFGTAVTLVYPNLYIIDDQDRVTLLTHGQYFEDNWSEMSNSMNKHWDRFVAILAKQFNLTPEELADHEIAKKIEAFKEQSDNFNLPQFIQANALVGNAQSNDGYETGTPAQLDILLRNYYEVLNDGKPPKVKPSTDYITVSKIIEKADGSKPSSSSDVEWYIYRTIRELMKLTKDRHYKISKFIYGHTHVPGVSNSTVSSQLSSLGLISSGSYVSDSKDTSSNLLYVNAHPIKLQDPMPKPNKYTVINTGGWLRDHPHQKKKEKFHGFGKPCGAVIPILENGEIIEIRVLK
ncbi:metallophosphoesterase [Sulfurimonas sp. HSL3-2]|uniref:metallophosphoesterase n=1 Tax=Hydrocurvibacter mobilis TaxID=3131936 RepID=UPI0031F93F27